jgi:hypothetical protein
MFRGEKNKMKTWKIITVAGVALVAVALATASALALMGGRGIYTPYGTNTATPYGTYTGTTTPYGTYYGGMMSGNWGCPGMRGFFGSGYTSPPTYYTNPTYGTQLNITSAVTIAKNYAASTGNTNLAVDEVEEYTNNFYVLVKEKDTGLGAFELLIDKYTGAVSPEMGPNMMWNTKYGMMNSGMMGSITGTPTTAMPVTVEQAKANAQQFLNANYPGTAVGDVDTFYGYYHVDVLQAGNIFGMLSVNGYTGQVWYHAWHGSFIQAVEL